MGLNDVNGKKRECNGTKKGKPGHFFFLVITEKYLINWFSVTVHTEKHLKMTLIRFDVKHSAMAAIFT